MREDRKVYAADQTSSRGGDFAASVFYANWILKST